MLQGFIDAGTDEATCSYIEKAQKIIHVEAGIGPDGKRHKAYDKRVTVSDDAEGEPPNQHSRQSTDKTSHLVPWKHGDPLPEHLAKVAIPPAWTDVRISLDPKADLWVIGYDSKGRRQSRYNPEFDKRQNEGKFARIQQLAKYEPKLVATIDKLREIKPDVADCLDLMRQTGLRPGSTRDTKAKVEARGATTLKGENVKRKDGKVYLDFIGKEGIHQQHEIQDKALADMLIKRKRKAGKDGNLFNVTDAQLRVAMKDMGDFKPKDLRTLLATKTARDILSKMDPSTSVKDFKKARLAVGEQVSKLLGNTRTMALNRYIDPHLFEEWAPSVYAEWKAA